MEEDLNRGTNKLQYDLSVPSRMSTFDISTVRVGRHGGTSDGDIAFRRELFVRLGAVTAAGGHVETAMKRLVLLLTTDAGRFSLVDITWSDLHGKLRSECTDTDETRKALAETLNWGEQERVKERRDNAIHAYWWLFDGCGARRSRFYRKSDGAVILATLDDLEQDAHILFQYAERLDALLGSDWPIAMLPPIN